MSKFIISMLNTLLCVFVIVLCLICVGVTDNWKECTIAIEGIVELLGGPLLVIGAIVCFDVFEPWPLKIIGMFAWTVLIFFVPSIINPRR